MATSGALETIDLTEHKVIQRISKHVGMPIQTTWSLRKVGPMWNTNPCGQITCWTGTVKPYFCVSFLTETRQDSQKLQDHIDEELQNREDEILGSVRRYLDKKNSTNGSSPTS